LNYLFQCKFKFKLIWWRKVNLLAL